MLLIAGHASSHIEIQIIPDARRSEQPRQRANVPDMLEALIKHTVGPPPSSLYLFLLFDCSMSFSLSCSGVNSPTESSCTLSTGICKYLILNLLDRYLIYCRSALMSKNDLHLTFCPSSAITSSVIYKSIFSNRIRLKRACTDALLIMAAKSGLFDLYIQFPSPLILHPGLR